MDDIRTAPVATSTSRALVSVAAVSSHARSSVTAAFGHGSASMSAKPMFAGIPAIEATKPATKRDGYEPTRNWYPARRPPGST